MTKQQFKYSFTRTIIVIALWGLFAFAMSFFYYFLKDKGIIWDNPSCNEIPWNGRKVIFGILSLSSFVLMIVQVVYSWDQEKE